jgi:outer membrane protein assembly factor BamE (lipoprotein component of BamABCDE complex)
MRTILLFTLSAILMLAAFSGCSTTVRTDNGHAVTTGVHTN